MDTDTKLDPSEILKKTLNQHLVRCNMTIIQFTAQVMAAGCERSIPHIRDWFRGTSTVRATDLVYIADVFGVTPNDLLGFD